MESTATMSTFTDAAYEITDETDAALLREVTLTVSSFSMYDNNWFNLKNAIELVGRDEGEDITNDKLPTSKVHLVFDDDSVSEVGLNALRFCVNLVKVTLPHILIIESLAFYRCEHLTEVEAPSTTKLHNACFRECGLTTVNMPSLMTIGESSFYECSDLKYLTIPRTCKIASDCYSNPFSGTRLQVDANRHFANNTMAYARWAAEPATRQLKEEEHRLKEENARLEEKLNLRTENLRLEKEIATLRR
jgi:hypothetical protein